MKELTLYFEYCDWVGIDLEEYLMTIDGIVEVKKNIQDSYVYVKYDNKKISFEIIKYEILFCIDGLRIPLIIAFDKHGNDNLEPYTIVIEDICCEYCFKGMIEDLLMTKGINSAKSDFDYNNAFNVKIDITYDKEIISKEEILKIEKELNK